MLKSYKQSKPSIDKGVFLAENCTVIGSCFLADDSSVWFNAVLRGDVNEIWIGKGTNIQDGCVVHCDKKHAVHIGEYVTVGHNAIIHGCTVGNNCLVGMGSTILDGAVIGDNVVIGANTLVTPGKSIPSGVLAVGSPAKVVRELSPEEIEGIHQSSEGYIRLSKEYLEGIV